MFTCLFKKKKVVLLIFVCNYIGNAVYCKGAVLALRSCSTVVTSVMQLWNDPDT